MSPNAVIPATSRRAREERAGFRASLRRYLAVLAGAVLIALALRICVLHAYRIPSSSMENTLLVGDYLLAERISYGATVGLPWIGRLLHLPPLRQPRRGDMVIFTAWDGPEHDFVKRCIAIPGDTVEVIENMLLVNGVPFDSLLARRFGAERRGAPRVKYLSREGPDYEYWHFAEQLRSFGPHLVPPGRIFVMGDNRDNSDDSRMKGDVPLTALRGKPMIIYWSAAPSRTRWGSFRHVRWSRVGQIVR